MIRDNMSLDKVLLSFESTLKIEYKERDTRKVIEQAKQQLESCYKVKIDTDIYTLKARNMLASEHLELLLSQITVCIKDMSLYKDICLYDNNIKISLASVSYLGLARDNLLTALKYLQRKDLYKKREEFISVLTNAVSNIEMSSIRRLFTILLTLESLGVEEGVSVVANYLYLGGLVE